MIALLNGEPDVARRWSEAPTAMLPAPVLAELLYGAFRSARRVDNEQGVRLVARSMQFIACDQSVCEYYAMLKATLAEAGRPIPENDLWVAACCLAAEATLVSRDAHFGGILGLHCEEW